MNKRHRWHWWQRSRECRVDDCRCVFVWRVCTSSVCRWWWCVYNFPLKHTHTHTYTHNYFIVIIINMHLRAQLTFPLNHTCCLISAAPYMDPNRFFWSACNSERMTFFASLDTEGVSGNLGFDLRMASKTSSRDLPLKGAYPYCCMCVHVCGRDDRTSDHECASVWMCEWVCEDNSKGQ